MPPLKPIKRLDLIYHLKQLGFDGRYSGKRHQFMLKDSLRVTILNPHQGDISANFLLKFWDRLKLILVIGRTSKVERVLSIILNKRFALFLLLGYERDDRTSGNCE
jgi:hypothetical protein